MNSSDSQRSSADRIRELPSIPAPEAAHPDRTIAREAVAPAEPRQLRILLVEDHEDTALSLAQLLEMAGYQVEIAASVGTALAHDERTFDFLISDLDLPDGSGLDVMRHLRDKGMRGIAVSGFGSDEDIRSCHEAGFKMHLTKPVDFSRLIAAIQDLTGA